MITQSENHFQRSKKKRNSKYIAQLDQRLSSVKMKLEKQKKLKMIKEREIEQQWTDRPMLSEGTKKLVQKGPPLNVFDRQQVLIQAYQGHGRALCELMS